MPSKIPLRNNRPKTICDYHCTSKRPGKDKNSEALRRTWGQGVQLPSLIAASKKEDDMKIAWSSNKKEKFPTIKGVDSHESILDKGSNSIKMLLNCQTYWKTDQSVLASRKPGLTLGILSVKRKADGRRPSSMLEISEHAQLIRDKIRRKTDSSTG